MMKLPMTMKCRIPVNLPACVLSVALILSAAGANAQTVKDVSDNDEILLTVGANVPMYKSVDTDVIVGLHYGHTWHNGLGVRAGFNYSPTVAEIDNVFGMPVAVTYRTKSRSTSQRIDTAFGNAYDAVEYDYSGNEGSNMLAGFLMGLFDRMEFYVGLTPGYIAGMSSCPSKGSWGEGFRYSEERWTEKRYSFSLTADCGLNINFQIWRFDLKLMPAFHYYITDNFILHSTLSDNVEVVSEKKSVPVRWFFSFSGGLAFRF